MEYDNRAFGQPVQQSMRRAGGISADQHPPARSSTGSVAGQLSEGLAGDRDVIGSGVGAGVAGAEHQVHGLTGAGRAVVDEGAQRVEAVAAFERRRGVLFVRMRSVHTRARAAARAVSIATRARSASSANVSTSREIVGSEATDP